MAAIIIPNCVEVRLKWLNGTIAFFNVLHAQYTLAGPLNPTVGESLFAAVKASAGFTTWNAHLATVAHFVGIGVRDLRTANNPELSSTGPSVPGAGQASALPPQVAVVVTLRTAFAGRSFRGRVYLGGLDGGGVVNMGVPGDPLQADAVSFVTAVKTALSGQSMALAIGQKELPPRTDKAGNQLPLRPANVIPVTQQVTVGNRFDTQRRRLQ